MASCKDCFHWNACKKMLEEMWGHCIPAGYEGGAGRCEDFISTADVAPRAEVAREIFEEIDKAVKEHSQGYCCDWYLYELIDKLKKKYTEEQK